METVMAMETDVQRPDIFGIFRTGRVLLELVLGVCTCALPAAGQEPADTPQQTQQRTQQQGTQQQGSQDPGQAHDGDLDRGRPSGDTTLPGRNTAPGDPVRQMDRMFHSMFDDLEQQFGIRVPRDRFFTGRFFGDLHDQVHGTTLEDFEGAGSALSLQIDEQGVRAVIGRKDAAGNIERKRYSAPSLQEFRERYPDVARQLGLGRSSASRGQQEQQDWQQGQQGQRQRLPMSSFELVPRSSIGESQDIPEGERLGVIVRSAISADLRTFLGLEEDQGLMVARVLDGTLAQRLGVQRHDILLEIQGERIASPEDVRAALADAAVGERVTVVVNRRGERVTLTAQKQAPAGQGQTPGGAQKGEELMAPQTAPRKGEPKSGQPKAGEPKAGEPKGRGKGGQEESPSSKGSG